MYKLTSVIILILLLNLVIGFEADAFSLTAVNLEESEAELERAEDLLSRCDLIFVFAETVRKEGQRCDSVNKCCRGFACNRMIMGLGFMGSVRCGRLRPKRTNFSF
ncbi:hypothetical protein CEXT_312051 [Caerostris extrusa]|uniref:Uncharacterized protein n=1 Tax=Caerostris extrusa TaxID=172846 RepID=A0AAV4WJL6_CAEEX|nr:hypothetical protein CEXT_312051 [Caerostris extrusa]